jgi:hypothetical protein
LHVIDVSDPRSPTPLRPAVNINTLIDEDDAMGNPLVRAGFINDIKYHDGAVYVSMWPDIFAMGGRQAILIFDEPCLVDPFCTLRRPIPAPCRCTSSKEVLTSPAKCVMSME